MRRKLTRTATALAVAALLSVAGCSSATPLSGASSDQTGAASNQQALAASSSPSSSSPSDDPTLPGLSTACSAAVNAQGRVADIFGRAVDGTKLTAANVRKTFDAIGAGLPTDLTDDVAALRDAAERSVGKSDVAVAEILQEKEVTAAREALSDYVQDCSPPTS